MEDAFDLRGFIFTLLKKWRLIVAMGLLFCVLGGGYKTVRSIVLLRDPEQVETQQKADQELYDTYVQQKMFLERDVESLQEAIERQEAYNQNSFVMGLEPHRVPEAVISFYIDVPLTPDTSPSQGTRADALADAYVLLARDGPIYERIRKEIAYDGDASHIREAVSVEFADANPERTWVIQTMDATKHSGILTIRSAGHTLEEAQQMSRSLYAFLSANVDHLSQSVQPHTLRVISRSSSYQADERLATMRKNNEDKLEVINKELLEKRNALLKLKEPTVSAISKTGIAIGIVKFLFLGGVGGVGVGVLLVFFLQVMDVRVRKREDVEIRFSIPCFGELPAEDGSSGKLEMPNGK